MRLHNLFETIRKMPDGKYRLYSKDGKKNLGTFDSRAAAEKHEREVQYFKHANEATNGVGHNTALTSPDNTVVVDTPSDLDWYKLGQHFPTLANFDQGEFGAGGSDTVITFANKEEADRFRAMMAKGGVKTRDIGQSRTHPEIHTKGKAVDEANDGNSDEVFHFGNKSWDVKRGYQLVKQHNIEPEVLPVEGGLASFLGFMRVNKDWAKSTDLSQPVLLIDTGKGVLVIDGYHRIQRAKDEGVEELPGYILSQEQADEIEIK